MPRKVEFSENITSLLVEILEGKHGLEPGMIIETGPYRGQGSMRMLAEAQLRSKKYPETVPHYALEAVWEFVIEARIRAKAYRWIRVIHALPTGLEEARQFIKNDKWRDKHPEILVDYDEPERGYLWEISDGHIGMHFHIPEQAWFEKHLPLYREKCPLFFLDGGGGTGWLEFQTMTALMGDTEYYVILDDCDSVKHWRSYEVIGRFRPEPHWRFIREANRDSIFKHPHWIVAFHGEK